MSDMSSSFVDPRQAAVGRLWEYLLNQGVMGYQFPTYDSTYMGDLYNLYEDMVLSDATIYYDSVTPKYEPGALAGDPIALQMGMWFEEIEMGKSPDQIIREQEELGTPLNETQIDDLNKFGTEKYARDKAANEFNFKASGAAELYGLPDPSQTFQLPPGIVRDLIRQKDGKTPQEAAARELLAIRQRAEADLKRQGKSLPTTKTVEKEPEFKEDPASYLYNKGIDAVNWLNKTIFKGSVASTLPESVRPSIAIGEGNKVTKPTQVTIPVEQRKYGGAAGGMISALENKIKIDAENEVKLQEALARQIMERFGTPYASALKEAARIAASRKKGASGNFPV